VISCHTKVGPRFVGGTILRALFLPPFAWQPYNNAYSADSGPSPFEIYEVLAKRGIQSEILDPHKRPLNPFSGRDTLLDSLDPTRALRVLTRRRDVDIVVSVGEGAAVPLVLAKRSFAFRPPIVIWDPSLTESWRLRERMLDIALPRVDGVMVLGENQVSYIEKRWHPRSTPRVIYHHVDANFFAPGPDAADEYILSVGDDVGRDFETLIRAVEGSPRHIKIKTRRPVSSSSTLGPGVEIISDRITYRELRALYSRCSFVVVPLKQTINASGVSTILEAGAMGKALIVSDNSAISDYIVPGETCLTVPCGNSAALRAAIERLSSDRDLRDQLGSAARSFVTSRFANRPFAEGLASVLTEYARQ
jgi:glycosyltransferase involved in cell wall biosynthesis